MFVELLGHIKAAIASDRPTVHPLALKDLS